MRSNVLFESDNRECTKMGDAHAKLFLLFILLFVWSCSCYRCGSRMVLVILLWQLLFTVLNYAYHYLSTLANMLLQMDRNCMILSSRWRSSSPLNKYVYLKKRRKQTGIVLTTASLKNIAISSEQTVSRNGTSW